MPWSCWLIGAGFANCQLAVQNLGGPRALGMRFTLGYAVIRNSNMQQTILKILTIRALGVVLRILSMVLSKLKNHRLPECGG